MFDSIFASKEGKNKKPKLRMAHRLFHPSLYDNWSGSGKCACCCLFEYLWSEGELPQSRIHPTYEERFG